MLILIYCEELLNTAQEQYQHLCREGLTMGH